MTTTPAPTDIDTLAVLKQAASTLSNRPWTWADLAADRELAKLAAMLLDVAPALLDELAKTRAELDEAKTLLHTIWYGFVNAPARERWLRLIREANPATTAEPAAPNLAGCVDYSTLSPTFGGTVSVVPIPDTTAEPADEPWPLIVSCPVCAAPERVWCTAIETNRIGHVHDERRGKAMSQGYGRNAEPADEDAEDAPCKSCGKPWRNRRHECQAEPADNATLAGTARIAAAAAKAAHDNAAFHLAEPADEPKATCGCPRERKTATVTRHTRECHMASVARDLAAAMEDDDEPACGHDRAKADDWECPECGADLAALDAEPAAS